MRSLKRMGFIGAVSLLLAATAACSSPTSANDANGEGGSTLSLARIGIAIDAAVVIGQQEGIYASHDLTVNDTLVANPPAALAALQGGQVDIAYSTTTSFYMALSQGVDLVAVAPSDGYSDDAPGDPYRYDNTGLFVNPSSGISSPADLAGKTVSVLARGAQLEATIAEVATKAGVDPTTINWIALDFQSAIEALKNGTIDAAGLVSPFTNQALEAGMTQISAPAVEFFGGGSTTSVWVTTPAILEQKGAAIDAFVAAQAEANEWANTNHTEAMTIAKEVTGVDLPVEELTPAYWPTSYDQASLQAQADRLHELGFVPATVSLAGRIYTPSS